MVLLPKKKELALYLTSSCCARVITQWCYEEVDSALGWVTWVVDSAGLVLGLFDILLELFEIYPLCFISALISTPFPPFPTNPNPDSSS